LLAFMRALPCILMLALPLSACMDFEPSRHSGFWVGMSQSEAFELACDHTNKRSVGLGPVLYFDGIRRPVRRAESICEIRDEALGADQWWIIERGIRDRYVVLDFADNHLVRLQVKAPEFAP